MRRIAEYPVQPGQPTVSDSILRSFTVRQEMPAGSPRALGWEVPTDENTGSSYLSAGSVGHTGFTGTSIWMDPVRGVVIVVLVQPGAPDARQHAVCRACGAAWATGCWPRSTPGCKRLQSSAR